MKLLVTIGSSPISWPLLFLLILSRRRQSAGTPSTRAHKVVDGAGFHSIVHKGLHNKCYRDITYMELWATGIVRKGFLGFLGQALALTAAASRRG